MQEVFKIFIGIAILILGIPIGNILAKNTKEELKDGKKWFLLIIGICLIGSILNLIFLNDVLLFTFLFIAIVTSRSLRIRKKNLKSKKRR
ncbi:MAG: hypothetical protein ACP5NZ_00635 [Nanobdellota archaeon]